MKRETMAGICVFAFLVAMGVVARVASNEWHVWNFAPVAATAMFAGYYLSPRSVAMTVPLLVMVLSNCWIARPYHHAAEMIVVYAAFMLPILFGGVLRKRLSTSRVASFAIANSLAFFLVTNFAHWCFEYELHTAATLGICFKDALEFYKQTLLGDLYWSAVLFGGYAFAARSGYLPAVRAVARVPA